jgi:hypothetical protein
MTYSGCDRGQPSRPHSFAAAGLGAAAFAGIFLLSACASPPPKPFPDLPRLTVSTQFSVQNLCDVGLSPRIALGGVPDGTASYAVQISDIMVLFQTPWRETIPLASKAEIPEGAAKTYEGPCLGDMTRFVPAAPYGYEHRVEVLAQDAQGQPLAYGSTTVMVESPYLTARRERLRQQQPGAGVSLPRPTSGGFPGFPGGAYGGTYGASPGNFPGAMMPMNQGVLQ